MSGGELLEALVALGIGAVIIFVVIAWIIFPIFAYRYLREIAEVTRNSEGHLRVLRQSYEAEKLRVREDAALLQ